jgi:hypothetical protein
MFVADEGRIIGLSLTLAPASLAARPLEMRRGDVRSIVDRGSWSGWREAPLLKRCVDQLPRLRVEQRRALHIVDRRQRDVDDYPLELRRPLRRGALEHGPPGRVISVR